MTWYRRTTAILSHFRVSYTQWTLIAAAASEWREHRIPLAIATAIVAALAFCDPVGKRLTDTERQSERRD